MSDLIPVVKYWPFTFSQRIIRWDYTDTGGTMDPLVALFYYDAQSNSLIYGDYDHAGNFKDNWYMRYVPGFGVAEWRDTYPNKVVTLSPAIGWGDMVRIGDTYVNQPEFDTFSCNPPQIGSGEQIVKFENHFDHWENDAGTPFEDVLVISYMQRWGNGKWAGARYWLAAGLGPCAVQWQAQNDAGEIITTTRMDGKITIYNGEAKVA
jgi:hypothetical protein